MPKVLSVKSGKVKNRIFLGIETDGEYREYSVPATYYRDIGSPVRFSEVGIDVIDELSRLDDEYRALRRAMSILSHSDKSERMLARMLIMNSGFSREIAEGAVRECVRLGYLDEERQLERLIEKEVSLNLRGRAYIKRKLASKGYSLSKIDSAIDSLSESGVIDFHDSFERLAVKKGAYTDEEKKALKYKYGYTGEV